MLAYLHSGDLNEMPDTPHPVLDDVHPHGLRLVARVDKRQHEGDSGIESDSGIPGPDLDGDGFTTGEDCDDDNASIHPDALETCDGVDNDCNGVIDDGPAVYTITGPYTLEMASLYLPHYLLVAGSYVDDTTDDVVVEFPEGSTGIVAVDAHDRPTRIARDFDDDGTYEDDWTVTWHETGTQWLTFSHTYKAEGYEEVYAGTRTYEKDGSSSSLYTYTYDAGGDGVFETFYLYERTYDEAGNTLTYDRDEDGDGVVDYHYESTYDEAGNLLTYDRDEDADGVVDYHYELTYDEHGNALTLDLDEDADGTFDYHREQAYGEHGWLTYDVDEDADGVIDSGWFVTFCP
jgi:hypothetical protein